MKMKKLVAVILAVFMIAGIMTGCGSSQSGSAEPSAVQSGPVTFTDDAGRAVEIPGPADLEKVYVTSPIGFIQIYTFDPEILAGTPMKFSEGELKYLDPVCAQMENLGDDSQDDHHENNHRCIGDHHKQSQWQQCFQTHFGNRHPNQAKDPNWRELHYPVGYLEHGFRNGIHKVDDDLAAFTQRGNPQPKED